MRTKVLGLLTLTAALAVAALAPTSGLGQGYEQLKVTLGGSQSQKNDGTIDVKAGCNETCTVAGKGKLTTVTFSGKKVRRVTKTFNIKKKSILISAGGKATLHLKYTKKARTSATRALKSSGRATAKITVTATDSAGNSAQKRRVIRLHK